MKKPVLAKERYSIIISSQADARKRAHVYSISKRSLVTSVCAMVITLGLCIGIITFSRLKVKEYSLCIAQLSTEEEICSIEYSSEPALQTEEETPIKISVSLVDTLPDYEAAEMLPRMNDSYEVKSETASSGPSSEKLTMVREETVNDYSASNQIVSVSMKDAIDIINKEFEKKINEKILSDIIKGEPVEYHILYDRDFEGDSEIVNNWADVLSVFVAKTMYDDDQKLLSIPSNRLELLSEIYTSMNKESIAVIEAPNQDTGDVVLYVYISINSLTYSEGAELFDLDIDQQEKIEQLMSSDYYIYFNELLGVDVFDGMNNEDVQQIIQNLPDTKGAEVVKAALIRLGSPYSKSKRGIENYVDCSYFSWWVYNQAGISIPTSSAEQARYCFDNGYEIEESDLMPGDLIFWSKKDCNCGRWNEIHHVGIYIGDGKIIDASSRNGCVVIRPLWGKDGKTWKIFMYARPE